MNSKIRFFATSLAFSSLLSGCATTGGQPIPTHAHADLKANASILVRGIT